MPYAGKVIYVSRLTSTVSRLKPTSLASSRAVARAEETREGFEQLIPPLCAQRVLRRSRQPKQGTLAGPWE
jgi:hypothetical protein